MVHAVIDMGSNTVRLVVYECGESGIHTILSKKEVAGLAGYVERGKLSSMGIAVACGVLENFRKVLVNVKTDSVSVFATASLRGVRNTEEAVQAIRQETGFSVTVLSGEEEAELDFAGAVHAVDVADGIMADVGGGSTELVLFRQKKPVCAASIPFGSLNLFKKYVGGLFPTPVEMEYIGGIIEKQLAGFPQLGKGPEEVLCGVGGTARACLRLICAQTGTDEMACDTSELRSLCRKLQKDQRTVLEMVLRKAPERVHTLAPGTIVLRTVADYFHTKRLVVSPYGVREGYLFKRVLKMP